MKLAEVVNIGSGYLFREKVRHEVAGEYQIIQIKDINDDNRIEWENLSKTDLKSVKQNSMVKKGDIVFRAKGNRFLATLIDCEAGKTIATSQFFILRVKQKDALLPEYLSWYINQSKAQRFLTQISAGTNIKQIQRKGLGELPVIVPAMAIQKTIMQLACLCQKEKLLVQEIQSKRQKLAETVMMKKISNE